MKKLEGLIAAAHTPFNADGSVNLALVKKQAETLIKQKVTGVYVSGTTGEGICCSIAERKAVFDAWVKAAKGKLYLIAHIGALALSPIWLREAGTPSFSHTELSCLHFSVS